MGRVKLIGAILMASLTSTLVTLLFSTAVDLSARTFSMMPLVCLCLPLAGLLGYQMYTRGGLAVGFGTGDAIAAATKGEPLPLRLVPFLFISTCATLLCGGSVGKEAASLQISITCAEKVRSLLHVDAAHSRTFMLCAMACALSVLLGTPIAGALFAFEVVSWRVGSPWGIPLAIGASIMANAIGRVVGATDIAHVAVAPVPSIDSIGVCLFIGISVCLLGATFCEGIGCCRSVLGRHPRAQRVTICLVGIAVAAYLLLSGDYPVAGTGAIQIDQAVAGALTTPYFIPKLFVTVALLGCGYKGGEFMPMMCLGAATGSYLAYLSDVSDSILIGLTPEAALGFYAAFGLACMMAACTNCPLAAIALGIEAFGWAPAMYFIPGAIICTLLTSTFSLYRNTFKLPFAP